MNNGIAAQVIHWLTAGIGAVNDREPAVSEQNRGIMILKISFPIRTTMGQGMGHFFQ